MTPEEKAAAELEEMKRGPLGEVAQMVLHAGKEALALPPEIARIRKAVLVLMAEVDGATTRVQKVVADAQSARIALEKFKASETAKGANTEQEEGILARIDKLQDKWGEAEGTLRRLKTGLAAFPQGPKST